MRYLIAGGWLCVSYLNLRTAAPRETPPEMAEAMASFEKGDYDRSIKLFLSLAKSDPKNAVYWFNLGNVLFLKGMVDSSNLCYQKVIDLGANLSLPAQLFRLRNERYSARFNQAYAILQSLEKTENEFPQNLRKFFQKEKGELQKAIMLETLAQMKAAEYDNALSNVTIALAIQPDSPAYLLRGTIYLHMNRVKTAKKDFRRAFVLGKNLQDRAESAKLYLMLNDTLSETLEGALLRLEGSAGYSSNIFDMGISRQYTAKAISSMFALFSYTLPVNSYQSWSFSDFLEEEEIFGIPEERTFRNVLQLNWKTAWLGAQLRVTPRFEVNYRNTYFYQLAGGMGLGAERRMGKSFAGFFFQTQKSLPTHESYSYLSGATHFLRPYWYCPLRNVSLNLAWIFQKEMIKDLTFAWGDVLPLSNIATGPQLTLSDTQLEKWDLDFVISYLVKFYDHPVVPTGEKRKDQQFQWSGSVSYEINRKWSPFFLASYLLNDSTLDETSIVEKRFDRWKIMGGVRWVVVP